MNTKSLKISFAILLMINVLLPTIVSAQKRDTVFIKQRSLDNKNAYYTDTIFFDSPLRRHILIGTTILPSTYNQIGIRGYGLYFHKITPSKCQRMEEHVEVGKVNTVIETDSTLTIDIGFVENCCYAFLCDASVDSTGTLKLIHYGYGNYCACNCCFGLTYHFTKATYETFPKINAIMINDERKTLKKIKR